MTTISKVDTDMIDRILELKKRCGFSDEIGKTHQLTMGDVDCISAIAAYQPLRSKELAEYMSLSPSRGSRIVGRLLQRGLVTMHPDNLDRRSMVISLTKEGSTCFEAVQQEKLQCEERILKALSVEEQQTVRKGLELLLHVI